MALIETLTTGLAASLVKSLAKMWLGADSFGAAGTEVLTETLKKHITNRREQRAVEKLFLEVEQEVEERLQAFIDVEFPDLPSNEKSAAVEAVAGSLEKLQLDRALLAADLDATRLELILGELDPGAFRHFDDHTTQLGTLLLRECCNYLVRMADKLPRFGLATSRELLLRTSNLLSNLKLVLDELGEMRRQAGDERKREAVSFEQQYRRAIVQHLDRIEIFGIRITGAGTRDYDLTSAYVPLTVRATDGNSRRVGEALAPFDRILIRGEAGFGKTTLMQWLAVQAAKRAFVGPLEPWNDRLPFYIRLRDFREDTNPFPAPEEFLKGGSLRHLAALLPEKGWVHHALQQGALVLIDGVDEVPASRRKEWLEWLNSMIGTFSASVFVVTSRPAALDAQPPVSLAKALEEKTFEPLALEPMSVADSETLVHRWHEAVARDLKGLEITERLKKYEKSLQRIIKERPTIRALASNPLLGAMMCTLNWDRQQRLPNDRMELYRLSLELLLDRREHERGIEGMVLDRPAKETLLSGIAVWMLRNGLSEAERERAEKQVTLLMQRLPLSVVEPSKVLQELLERSGVLRQPQYGIVDFVHRTFLEYLGARALIEQDDIDYLIEKAREEAWREVIVFAAGHTAGRMRDTFMSKLLRNRLFSRRAVEADVAAVCCMETIGRDIDPEIMARLQAKAAEMFPPATAELAALLAPAAELNPDLLLGHENAGTGAVAACIRTAALIGTRPMLDIIATYAESPGRMVDVELIRAWDVFDDSGFEEKVISKRSNLLGVDRSVLSRSQDECLRILLRCGLRDSWVMDHTQEILTEYGQRGELRLLRRSTGTWWQSLAAAEARSQQPQTATAASISDIIEWAHYFPPDRRDVSPLSPSSLRGLHELPELRALSLPPIEPATVELIARCNQLRELSLTFAEGASVKELARLTSLRSLSIHSADWQSRPELTDLEAALKGASNLREILLSQVLGTVSLAFIGPESNLRGIGIDDCDIKTLDPMLRATQLSSLLFKLSSVEDYSPLAELSSLATLRILYPNGAIVRPPYERMFLLERLEVAGAPPSFIQGLSKACALRDLVLTTELPEDSECVFPPTLVRLAISQAPGYETISTKLGKVFGIGRGRGSMTLSLARLGPSEQLEEVYFEGIEIHEMGRLLQLPKLRTVSFKHCSGDFGDVPVRLAERGTMVSRE